MSIWAEVREQARLQHLALAGSQTELVSANALLNAAEKKTGIRRETRPPEDALLDGSEAVYDSELNLIIYSEKTDARLAAFHIAHEYAHHWLDEKHSRCVAQDLDLATPAEPEMSLVGESDAYSPKERKEAQANLYAREFLLPREKLRSLSQTGMFDAAQIADKVGVPLDLVLQQLADALLLPEERPRQRANAEPDPDRTQLLAINASTGPHLVRAGPGTGKTRTLVGRVKRLIEDGEDPASILVLTFSNFAAQDLASRIRRAVGEAATAIWVGTFHAFGLELLRKYGGEIGLPIEVRLLDRSDSLMLLEDLMPRLRLNHYLDLVEPLMKLRLILAAMSRAKDELVNPEQYKEAARAIAGDDEFRAKAIEVAEAYAVYESAMRERGCVDFGDLIVRPVELFRTKPEIRAVVRSERRHVLVDEYQDMNRASGLLLRELVEPGRGPWVVGDVKQAIYRFRGGSPLNMARFESDFPGATFTDLGVNYRSGGRLIRAFQQFEHGMTSAAFAPVVKLAANRGEQTGTVDFNVASTSETEFEGIAQAIKRHTAKGGRYGDHAILARSHTTLARLAKHLERRGVPTLYFGNFFEREEIRDLLSLLSVVSEKAGIGLLRVAELSQYSLPHEDVATLFRWRRDKDVSMLAALKRITDVKELSEDGRLRLSQLARDVADVDFPLSPHRFLLRFLFRRGEYLRTLVPAGSVRGQQQRLAIYQLLQFAFAFRTRPGKDPKRALLDQIRRLEILDEEKQLRQLPAAASDIDAVRMMTVHASKGLQFPIVHIPSLTSRHFPINRPDMVKLPPGLIGDDALMSREAEEESLFFVALSRAEDGVNLSRAIYYGGGGWSDVPPSPFLERISAHLSKPPSSPADWTEGGEPELEEAPFAAPEERESWPAAAIEAYISCPRSFYYDHVLGLEAGAAFTPYLQLNRTMRSTIGWMQAASSDEERAIASTARLATDWEGSGLRGHALETIYRAAAETMTVTASKLIRGASLAEELTLTVAGNVTISCRVDHVGRTSKGIEVFRFKLSRLATAEKPKARYGVIQAALQERYPGTTIEFEHVSLLTGERRKGTLPMKRLAAETAKLSDAIAGITSGRFDAISSDYDCPRCSFFFICPTRGQAASKP